MANNIVDKVPAFVSSSGEHSYCARTSKKRKATAEDVENELYKETINELKEIKKGVFNMNDNLYQINRTLKELKEAIFENQKFL